MLLLYENIRKYRRLKGLNQVELGQSLGVFKQCISNWENDNVLPSVEMLVRLADFLRCPQMPCWGGTPAEVCRQTA